MLSDSDYSLGPQTPACSEFSDDEQSPNIGIHSNRAMSDLFLAFLRTPTSSNDGNFLKADRYSRSRSKLLHSAIELSLNRM